MISEYEYLADDATTYHIPVRDDFALALSMTPEAGGPVFTKVQEAPRLVDL